MKKIDKANLIDVSKIKNLKYFIEKCDLECIKKSYALYLLKDNIVDEVIKQFNDIGKSVIEKVNEYYAEKINKYFIVDNKLYFINFEYEFYEDEDEFGNTVWNLDEIIFYIGQYHTDFEIINNDKIKLEIVIDDDKLKKLKDYMRENNIHYKTI